MDKPWEQLYQLQDEALAEIQEVRQGLYLTGGTALSRGYYQHRYSDEPEISRKNANGVPSFSSGLALAPTLRTAQWVPTLKGLQPAFTA